MQIKSLSPDETRAFGAKLAKETNEGTVYALIGSLGSGKTEFVRGFVAALSSDAAVSSPTFTIVNTYPAGKFIIHHFDFYRIRNADELIEIGFQEYINNDDVCLIEWADMFPEVFPEKTIFIQFKEEKSTIRFISVDN